MEEEVKRRILRSSAMYGVAATFLIWVVYFNEFTLGNFDSFLPYLPEQLASMSLHVILLPLLVSVSTFYVASVFSAAFEGSFNELIVGSLYAAGFAVFFALFLVLSPGSTMINSAGYLFMAAFAVLLIYNMMSTLSGIWRIPSLKAVAASITIYLEGQLTIRLLDALIGPNETALPVGLAGVLNELLGLGMTVAAVISLLAVLKNSGKASLSAVGGVASNYPLVISTCVVGSLYFNYLRGSLNSISPGIASLSPYIEWTAICVAAALIFTRARGGMQASMMAETKMGDWIKHVQEVASYKGDRFVELTGMIDDFVEQGRRERLMVKLAMFLHDNGVEDDEIALTLSDLINYEDIKKPFFSPRGKASTLDWENRTHRRKILWKTVDIILPMDLGLPEFKEFGYGTAEDEGGSMDQPSGSGSGSDDVMIEENRK
jgi:hypothetical protein